MRIAGQNKQSDGRSDLQTDGWALAQQREMRGEWALAQLRGMRGRSRLVGTRPATQMARLRLAQLGTPAAVQLYGG